MRSYLPGLSTYRSFFQAPFLRKAPGPLPACTFPPRVLAFRVRNHEVPRKHRSCRHEPDTGVPDGRGGSQGARQPGRPGPQDRRGAPVLQQSPACRDDLSAAPSPGLAPMPVSSPGCHPPSSPSPDPRAAGSGQEEAPGLGEGLGHPVFTGAQHLSGGEEFP